MERISRQRIVNLTPELESWVEWVEADSDEAYDFEDVDCEDCGKKFFVRPSLYAGTGRQYPTKCERCRKGLAPLYEY